jgi:hypothetical protein
VIAHWKPLYKYLRVIEGRSPSDAEQLVRGFLKQSPRVTRANARSLLEYFVSTEHTRYGRGTPLEVDAAEGEIAREERGELTAEEYFEREWVKSIFTAAVERLRESSHAGDFALFETYDLEDITNTSYRALGARLSDSSGSRLATIRRHFRSILLETLREMSDTEEDYRTEALALLGIEV